jgi:nickel/cobalt transporter (NiCoT) family protein
VPGIVSTVLNEGGADLRRRLIAVYAVLIGGNILIWLWALVVLGDRPLLLGTALLAYTFGLRHAVDADHIAAIDNVTRKLMQQGQSFRSAIPRSWSSCRSASRSPPRR